MIALVTCTTMPEPDADEALLLAEVRRTGAAAEVVSWDDARVDWSRYQLVVPRSTWNYVHRFDAFLAWCAHVDNVSRLLNPLPVIRWNAHKGYLRDIAARGIATVPTEWVAEPRKLDIDVVIKPAVSAGSHQTYRVRASDPLPELPRGDWMVQPYVKSVDGYGERAIVWIDGTLTHAVRKSPRFAGGGEVVAGGMEIADDERAFAERVIATLPEGLLYARVDVARAESGELQMMELELIEPSLFLAQGPPGTAARFARAITARL